MMKGQNKRVRLQIRGFSSDSGPCPSSKIKCFCFHYKNKLKISKKKICSASPGSTHIFVSQKWNLLTTVSPLSSTTTSNNNNTTSTSTSIRRRRRRPRRRRPTVSCRTRMGPTCCTLTRSRPRCRRSLNRRSGSAGGRGSTERRSKLWPRRKPLRRCLIRSLWTRSPTPRRSLPPRNPIPSL